MIAIRRFRVTFITPIGKFQDVMSGDLDYVESIVAELVRGARAFYRISYSDEVVYLSGEVLKNSVIQITALS